ncbi:hypothetical protein EV126DRAFT_77354 [Verticillium dahliae]|nr:hypothetical protein EV126DRAFT_77354 [Verticillium dahliae]
MLHVTNSPHPIHSILPRIRYPPSRFMCHALGLCLTLYSRSTRLPVSPRVGNKVRPDSSLAGQPRRPSDESRWPSKGVKTCVALLPSSAPVSECEAISMPRNSDHIATAYEKVAKHAQTPGSAFHISPPHPLSSEGSSQFRDYRHHRRSKPPCDPSRLRSQRKKQLETMSGAASSNRQRRAPSPSCSSQVAAVAAAAWRLKS